MSKIVQFEEELVLTYSWSSTNHGICGHTFEVIDYFMILKDHFNTCILLGEDIDWNELESSISNKYDFSEEETLEIKNSTKFANRPKLLRGKNILFVDGGIINNKSNILLFDNIFYFACGNKEIKYNDKDNVYILQDDRVYDSVLKNGINYKKKILFDRLINPISFSNDYLMYGTKNCRKIFDEDLKFWNEKAIEEDFRIVCLVNEIPPLKLSNIDFKLLPYNNFMSRFGTYIYTPVPRKFDCSPRLIAECKYFKKEVIYYNIDYLEEDKGLYWRKWDVENDFEGLFLKKDDDLICILREKINV